MNIYEKFSNMTPGKYWSIPAARKHLLEEYLDSPDYIPMIKIDGYWARAIIWDGQVLIQSRGITKATETYGTYTEQVPHIVADLSTFPNGTVLLGEIAFEDLTKKSNDVGSILRSNPNRAIRLQEERGRLKFFVFDILAFEGVDISEKPFLERITWIVHRHIENEYDYVKMIEIHNPGSGRELLSKVWDKGGEGIILVKKDLPYNIGNAKAWHSIKVKRSLPELEGKVLRIIHPTIVYEGSELETWNYWKDGAGNIFTRERFLKGEKIIEPYEPVTSAYFHGRAVGVVVEYQGREINITSGTTDEDGRFLATSDADKMIKNGELYAVFTGMELTETSVRHPSLIRLRDDI